MLKHTYKKTCLILILFWVYTSPAFAAEHPIAQPKIYQNKVEAAMVWLQPIKMEPQPTTDPSKKIDIHNEVDLHEIKGAKMGFGAGGWIPDATIACTISKRNSKWRIVFPMTRMVANDGPHYGRNLTLDGPGTYDELCHIDPPDWSGFMRHIDAQTGVAPFFKPFTISGSFTYIGSGKAGGY